MSIRPTQRAGRAVVALAASALAGSALVATTQTAQADPPRPPTHPAPSAAVPTVSGPVTGGVGSPALLVANYPLASVGYAESEYLFSGTATSYTSTAPLGTDGTWSARPAATAPYTSRLVVIRPQDPRTFSGTVVVEWLNVSSGADGSPDWSLGHDDLIRKGDVYVGVSAQAVGVNALKVADPARYAGLSHPGDSFSYDMYSQAGQAIRAGAPSVLGDLQPQRVIAEGESQSAFRMTTYVNAVAPLVNVYDSYLINSRSGTSAALSQAPQADVPAPAVVQQRDIGLPVLTFQTETDVAGPLGYLPARQDDSRTFRLWEVAGASHADTYLVAQAADDNTSWASDLDQFASMTAPPASVSLGGFSLTCPVPFNAGQQHYAFQTAQRNLIDWTRTGIAPRSMPRLSVDTSTTPASYRLDAQGNVLGGVRTPAVDAPIATLSGLPPAGAPGFCRLFGQTHPFTPSQLSALYPTQHDFAKAWKQAVLTDLKAGYLLREDATRLDDLVGS
ncbi:MAG: hypothetical protein JWL64_214 [Frankiales bacterium]|nr:hypothetical protein [Frankiales bacterium]